MSEHRYTLTPSAPDHRDFRYAYSPLDRFRLPRKAVLSFVPPVRDQGAEGSCTGFGLTMAREIAAGIPLVLLSPAYQYYMERLMEGTADQDNGATIRDGCEVLLKTGAVLESEFPYVAGGYRTAPPAGLDAHFFVIQRYERLYGLTAIKHALAAQRPVVVGFSVWEGFERVGADGMVAAPTANSAPLGGHCVNFVGYNDHARVFTLRNQWGVGWGHGGDCYIPYAVAADPNWFWEYWSVQ